MVRYNMAQPWLWSRKLTNGWLYSFIWHVFFSAFSSTLTDTVFVLKWPTLSLSEHLGESTTASRPLSVVFPFHTEMLN